MDRGEAIDSRGEPYYCCLTSAKSFRQGMLRGEDAIRFFGRSCAPEAWQHVVAKTAGRIINPWRGRFCSALTNSRSRAGMRLWRRGND
jgi:hypothetical protein